MPILTKAAAIACACAVLLLCMVSAHAQTQNDDRYGFLPVPAPTVPVQQTPLGPPVNAPAYAQGYAPPNQGYAPAPPVQQMPPQYAQQQSAPPPYGAPQYGAPQYPPLQAQGYVQPMQAPVAPPPQGRPQQAYGYTPLRPDPSVVPQNQGAYYTAADSRYGTQMAADPNAYYMASSNGQNFNTGYRLGPGDKIRVSVFGEEDLTGEYPIDSSGMVRLPLIGTIRAAGFTAPSLENAIAGALAQGYLKSPRVNVEVSTYRPFYVIGAVNRPGEYPYVANMTALNAIAFGGGFTDQAKQSTVYVRHEGSVTEEAMPANQLTQIYPGDVIKVKNTVFWDTMAVFSPLAGPLALAAAIH